LLLLLLLLLLFLLLLLLLCCVALYLAFAHLLLVRKHKIGHRFNQACLRCAVVTGGTNGTEAGAVHRLRSCEVFDLSVATAGARSGQEQQQSEPSRRRRTVSQSTVRSQHAYYEYSYILYIILYIVSRIQTTTAAAELVFAVVVWPCSP
jgi:hypothetical protein